MNPYTLQRFAHERIHDHLLEAEERRRRHAARPTRAPLHGLRRWASRLLGARRPRTTPPTPPTPCCA